MIRDGDGKDAEELASSLCRYYEARNRAEHWLGAVARRDRNLFAHWKFGILPSVGEGVV